MYERVVGLRAFIPSLLGRGLRAFSESRRVLVRRKGGHLPSSSHGLPPTTQDENAGSVLLGPVSTSTVSRLTPAPADSGLFAK